MDETMWKTVLGSDESKFEICLGKQRRSILWAKEERDHVTCYQRSVLKFALAPVVWHLAHLERQHRCWKVFAGFAAYSPIQVFFRKALAHFSKTITCYMLTASITTTWLHSRRVRVWTSLPAVQTFPQLKTFGPSWNERYRRSRTVKWPESPIRKEWDSIPQFPDCF